MITYKYTLTTFRSWLTGFAGSLGLTLDGDTLQLPAHLGKGYLRVVDLPGGLEALLMDFTLFKSFLIERAPTVREHEHYVFCCEQAEHVGKLSVTIDEDRTDTEDRTIRSMYLLSYLSDLSQFATAGTHVSSVRVILSPEWLGRYLHIEKMGDVLRRYLDLKAQSVHVKDIDFENLAMLKDILDPATPGEEMKETTYIQNRVMLLLEHFFTWMSQQMSLLKWHIRMSRDEIDAILNVEALLVKDLSCAPTISQLAKISALSPSKLKKQFKDVFGMPIYEHFQKARMTRARELLLEGGRSVKEVGMGLGYTNLSNFSLAFRKVFGVLPSIVGKASKS